MRAPRFFGADDVVMAAVVVVGEKGRVPRTQRGTVDAPMARERGDRGFSLSLGAKGGEDLRLKPSARLSDDSHAPRRAVQSERRQSVYVMAARGLQQRHLPSDGRPRAPPRVPMDAAARGKSMRGN